jgi:hypothetical protein
MSRLLRESVVVGIMVVTTSVFNVRKVVVSCEWRLWVVNLCECFHEVLENMLLFAERDEHRRRRTDGSATAW